MAQSADEFSPEPGLDGGARASRVELHGMSPLALEAMYLLLPDAVVHTDFDRRIVACNAAAEQLFGKREALIGKSVSVIYADEKDFDAQRARFNRTAPLEGAPYDMRYRRSDGAVFWGETVGRPVRDEAGDVVGYLGIIRDVTEERRWQARRDLLARVGEELASTLSPRARLEAAARIAADTIADTCAILMPRGNAVRLAALGIRDRALEPDVRAYFEGYVVGDATSAHGYAQAMRTGNTELLARVDDATRRQLARSPEQLELLRRIAVRSAINVPLLLGGVPVGVMVLAIVGSDRAFDAEDAALAEELGRRIADAFEHARLYEEAERERTRFRSVHAASPDGFLMFRPVEDARGEVVDFHVVMQNDAAARIAGRAKDESVIGARVLELYPGLGDSPLFEAYRRVLRTGEPETHEGYYGFGRNKGWFRVTVTSADDSLAIGFVDITRQRRTEERLRVLATASAALSASLDPEQILADVAKLFVPALADYCTIDLVEDGRVRRAGSAQYAAAPPGAAESWWKHVAHTPGDWLDRLVTTRETRGIVTLTEAAIDAIPDAAVARSLRVLGVRQSIAVPVATRDRVFGALTVLMAGSGRVFSEGDVETCTELGGRIGVALENARLFAAEKEARQRVGRLQQLATALSSAFTAREVADIVCNVGASASAASRAAVWLVDRRGDLELISAAGFTDEQLAPWRRIPADSEVAAARVARASAAVAMEDDAAIASTAPTALKTLREAGVRSSISLPLRARGKLLGVFTVSYTFEQRFSAEKRAYLDAIAEQCGQAFERARLLEVERRTAEHVALLAKAGESFAASSDYESLLQSVADAALPTLGDFAVFDVVEGDRVRRVCAAHEDDEVLALLRASAWCPSPRADKNVCALTHGEAAMHADIDDAWLAGVARDPDHLARARRLGVASVITVPLRHRGELLGALTVFHGKSRRRHDDDDLRLAEELARRAASAVSQACLFQATQDAARRAEEASRVKDEFLATVSHELRTPLNAILGWATLLRSDAAVPASSRKGLDAIHRNAHAQARIVEDILDVSRIITGKLKIEPKPVDLASIVRQALDVVRVSAEAKDIELSFDGGAEPTLLVADPDRVQQVAWNLVSNAVKFSDAGGRVKVTVGKEGTAVVLRVEDHGRGIDPAFLPFVFDRFRQADSSMRRAHGGLGLGLAIVRHIVELHGGSVSAASDGEGKGAAFTVRLPVRAVAPPRSDAPSAPPGAARGAAPELRDLRGVRVLAVDDEADARELLHAVLAGAGAEVRTAASVAEALDALEREPPDVLVCDLGMPGEDGYDLIRRLRARDVRAGGAVPSIALTAYTRAEDRRRAVSAGFTTHMAKPVDPDDLVSAVANLAMLGGARRRP